MRRSWSVRPASSSVLGLGPQPLEHPAGQRRVEERLASAHTADGVDEIGAPHLLQHVAGRPRHDGGEQRLVVGERGEHQAARPRDGWERISRHTSTPSPSGEADVEDGDVGLGWPGSGRGLLGGAGLTDDLEVVLGLEQLAQRRGGRPRGRRGGTPGCVIAPFCALRRRRGRLPAASYCCGHVRGSRSPQPARAPRRGARPRLGSRPSQHAPADRGGGGRAGRCPLRRARRARRHRHPPGPVHHRRHRRRHAPAHR